MAIYYPKPGDRDPKPAPDNPFGGVLHLAELNATLTEAERETLPLYARDVAVYSAVERIVAAHVHQVEAERDEAIAQSQRALQRAHVAEFQTAAVVARVQELAPLRALERIAQRIERVPFGTKCVGCGHSSTRHNDLAYCQVGQCSCEAGSSVMSEAIFIRREIARLRAALAATDTSALDKLLAEAKAEALQDAADALDRWQSAEAHIGDPACEGPRGASAAYQCYLDACEVPQDWLRDRAARIARKGGESNE